MIYLITGVPGSGKTLYAVSTLVQKLLKEKIKIEGTDRTRDRRLVVDGVSNLVIPHELMVSRLEPDLAKSARGIPVESSDDKPKDEGMGLWNWYTWCQPGDVILVDEVQRFWRPRGMGMKPPPEIQMLETHRHLGVDFVIITQNPMLIDQNVRRLVGRHLNVRRLFGMQRALIYDWDGCQSDVHRTQGSTRSVWSYPKSAYKLYKSAEAHTKQKQAIPLWMAFPLVVGALGVAFGPTAYATLTGVGSGKGLQAKPSPAASAPALPSSSPGTAPTSPASAASPASPDRPGSFLSVAHSQPEPEETVEIQGCIKFRGRCRCTNDDGQPVDADPDVCKAETMSDLPPKTGGMISHVPESIMPSAVNASYDGELLRFMRERSLR